MSIAQGFGAPSGIDSRLGAHVDLAAYGHAKVRHRIREWERTHRLRTIATDVGSGVLGVAAGLLIREALVERVLTDNATSAQEAVASVPWAAYLVLVVVWVASLASLGAYATRFAGAGTEMYRAVVRAAVSLVAMAACVSFFFNVPFSRLVIAVAVPVMLVLSLVSRRMLRQVIARQRLAGASLQATLLVGDARAVREMAHHIGAHPSESGMRVIGACVTNLYDPAVSDLGLDDIAVLGGQHNTLEVVERCGVEAVAVASNPDMNGQTLRRLGWSLEQQDVDLLIAPGIVDVAGPRLTMRPAAGVPMLHVERPVSSGLRYGVKMVADRLIALLLIVLASPVLIGIGVLVRRDSSGPAFFSQERVGEGGRTFRMIKFRTMVVGAEARLAQLAADADAGNVTMFKMRTDPRVTRVGAVLRRFSLDELPQLFNVLRGEMSLVGPRPPLPSEVDTYESDAVRRLRVRPGMTGLWQVSGRSDLSWGDSVRLDLWYVDNWSLALDTQILIRTARAVAAGKGAY